MMINDPVNSPEDKNKIIELTLPLDAAYISAARLTSSSIANRMGFGIEEIEDIKTAVSEACTFVIEKSTKLTANPASFVLRFNVQPDCLIITLESTIVNFMEYKEETGLLLIRALMNEVELKVTQDTAFMILKKKHNAFSV